MKTCYIHIGYPKTASSTLQRFFFSKHPELLHLGYPFIAPEIQDIIQIDIMQKSEILYSASRAKKIFDPYLEKANSSDKYKAVGISYEGLCLSADGGQVDNKLIACRLKEIFGNAKIIITIRNQFDFLQSFYNQMIKTNGCYFSFHEFLEANYWRFYIYLFHQLYYFELFKCYQEIFGEDQVRIFLFEDFKNDPQRIIGEICLFLRVSPIKVDVSHTYRSLSSVSIGILRIVNYVVRNNFGRSYLMPLCPSLSPVSGMSKEIGYTPSMIHERDKWRSFWERIVTAIDRNFNLKPAKMEFRKEWRVRIASLYKQSNQRLMDETGLDLKKYNYPL
jgi:hypothetical protein